MRAGCLGEQVIKPTKIRWVAYVNSMVFVMSIFWAFSGHADETEVLTLESAIELAREDNKGLAVAVQGYLAARARPEQASALPDPVLTIGAMNFPSDSLERDQEPMTQVQLGIKQSFPFPGKRGLREESAAYMAELERFSLEEKRLSLKHMVTVTWWEIFYLDKALKTIEKNKTLLRQLIKVAETKYETGEGLQQDVLLSHLELSKVLERELALQSSRKKQVSLLNALLNRKANSSVKLPESVDEQLNEVYSEERLYEMARDSSPLLKKSELKVSRSESQLALAKKGYMPDFSVGVTYGDRDGQNPPPMGGDRTDFVSLMVGVTIPLYGSVKQGNHINETSAEAQAAVFAHKDALNNLLAEITSEHANYTQLAEQLSLFRYGIIPQSRQTTESMMAGYQVSQVDFLNLVRSQLSLLNYELLYWKTLANAHKSLSKLESLVGEDIEYE